MNSEFSIYFILVFNLQNCSRSDISTEPAPSLFVSSGLQAACLQVLWFQLTINSSIFTIFVGEMRQTRILMLASKLCFKQLLNA